MIAKNLINHMIPPLKMTDKAEKAIIWMEELKINQLPVIENAAFKGFISEEVIFEENNVNKQILEYKLLYENCHVDENQHIYDILKLASDYKIQMVAVLGEANAFIGIISVQDIIAVFAQTTAIQSPGSILVLSLPQIDYSLAEISRLIESNNVKVLSSCVTNDILEPSKIRLTVKVNRPDITHVVATLERFGYKIVATYQEGKVDTNEKERLDLLLRYLNI